TFTSNRKQNMMKTLLALGLLASTQVYFQTGPITPMDNYQFDDISENQVSEIWNSMKTGFKSSSECFNRAMSWTYDINKQFGVRSRKLIIHYSLKYNQELSAKWGFHIAPLLSVENH